MTYYYELIYNALMTALIIDILVFIVLYITTLLLQVYCTLILKPVDAKKPITFLTHSELATCGLLVSHITTLN